MRATKPISAAGKIVAKIKSDAIVLYLCYKDKRTPISAKIISVIALALAFSPIDLIPDFIPVFGYLDDLIIIPLLIFIAFTLIPKEIISENRYLSVTLDLNDHPVFKKGAIAIVLVWIITAVLIILLILKKYFNIFSSE